MDANRSGWRDRSLFYQGRTLLVGTGRESTRQTIAASRRAAALGADAVLVRTPFFFKAQMTPDVLIAHYRAVADASPVPVLLYNMPHNTGVVLTPPIVRALHTHPNIIGLKETSIELERLGQFVAQAPSTFSVLCGAAAANVVPEVFTRLHADVRAGRIDAARRWQQEVTTFARLVTTVHGVAGLKAAMDMAGYQGGVPRSPLAPVSAAAASDIRAELDRVRALP